MEFEFGVQSNGVVTFDHNATFANRGALPNGHNDEAGNHEKTFYNPSHDGGEACGSRTTGDGLQTEFRRPNEPKKNVTFLDESSAPTVNGPDANQNHDDPEFEFIWNSLVGYDEKAPQVNDCLGSESGSVCQPTNATARALYQIITDKRLPQPAKHGAIISLKFAVEAGQVPLREVFYCKPLLEEILGVLKTRKDADTTLNVLSLLTNALNSSCDPEMKDIIKSTFSPVLSEIAKEEVVVSTCKNVLDIINRN